VINDLKGSLPNHCIEPDSGVDFEVANFATNQRLFSIYDGPSYEASNAYLDIEPRRLNLAPEQCQPTKSNSCPGALKLYGRLHGMPRDEKGTCYLPNAAHRVEAAERVLLPARVPFG
jgi:cell migration-inducing and hyaluronan-binding protein